MKQSHINKYLCSTINLNKQEKSLNSLSFPCQRDSKNFSLSSENNKAAFCINNLEKTKPRGQSEIARATW